MTMLDNFTRDTQNHTMKILRDDGLYRHLRFSNPEEGFYWFELITWPNGLTIRGDMGTYTFSRIEDMFCFFRGKDINSSYWAEKCISESVFGDGIRKFSLERFREVVNECVDEYLEDTSDIDAEALREAVKEDLLDRHFSFEHEARQEVEDFYFGKFAFHDFWETTLTEYTPHFLWNLYAIQWGINQYDAQRSNSTPV